MEIVSTLSKLALLGSAWVLWLLLALSVLSLTTAIERWWFFRRNFRAAHRNQATLLEFLRAGQLEQATAALRDDTSVQGEVLRLAARRLGDGPSALADAVDGEFARKRAQLERGLNLLGTIGNNAPFIGLFGTVIGVIQAFHNLTLGNDQAMGLVMQGISEALVATAVGIFVALPAVVAYNTFSKQVSQIDTDVQVLAKLFTAALHGRPAAQSSRG
jgi:biopolymer transport protein ExbB/biopolymer transport protein TolQ